MLEGIAKKKIPQQVRDDRECRDRDDRECRGWDDCVMKNVTGFFTP